MVCGKDVATAFGYAKNRNVLAVHVDEEDKKDALIQGPLGGPQMMTVINESGLYALVLSSKLPTAKAFKRWVTAEGLHLTEQRHFAYYVSWRRSELGRYTKVRIRRMVFCHARTTIPLSKTQDGGSQ